MRRLVLIVLLVTSSLFAQDSKQRFRIELKPANLSGTDEYTIVKSADGYKIAGNTNLKTSNGPMTFMHSEEVAPDWTMISYKLVATGNGASQSVELIRIGDHITAAAKVGEQTVPKEIAWKPNTLVLDNFIAAHFQVLLNAIAAAKPESKSNWNLIVAQRLTEAFGKVNPKTETASGTLDGKQISLKKYSLELGGLLVEIWADAASNQFMRAYIPLQQFEIAREGFELTVPKAIEVFPSNCNERLFHERESQSAGDLLPAEDGEGRNQASHRCTRPRIRTT
jgi:hypothetical protein